MIYSRKKLTKCPNFFIMIFARKIFFPNFLGGGGKFPPTPVSYAYADC